ncbi:hypothetical protein [Pseudomonas chlororaphis]|uniref:hypothetical protein n=1 Tax=Pseudomonas chlororaphis TaxID=587753 RepID=UPI0015DE86E1|nr:hypothetical protein [Pseudomonas chlororaphis]QLL14927.1 hypothetical protein H0I86_07530 [Pseudomonas chlororaphis subsp. aurantiaca]
MKENLKVTFAKDLEALVIPWNKSPQCDSEKAQDYYWLPIFDLSEGRAKVGITLEGVWGIAKDGCIRILSDERSYVFLLPILEKSP